MAGQSSSSAPEVGVRLLLRKRLHVHRMVRPRCAGRTPAASHPAFSTHCRCRTEHHVLRCEIREPVHQYSPSMPLKSVVWLWYPTRMLWGFSRSATPLISSAVFSADRPTCTRAAPASGRSASVPDRFVEIDAGGELVALQLVEGMVEAARLQPRPVQVRAPLLARLVLIVLELMASYPMAAATSASRNVAGQLLRTHQSCVPMGTFSSSRPGASMGARSAEAAAAPPSRRMSRRSVYGGHECVLLSRTLECESLRAASQSRTQTD